MIPPDVVSAWGWEDAEVTPLPGGLINATFAVRRDGEPIAVVQRLHPVFAPEVNLDLEAVTRHLVARGLETPRLLRTRDGAAWVERDGTWRALSWVDGVTVHTVPDLDWAAAGGALVGRFHRAVADLAHDYRFTRAGVHDTAGHLARLAARLATPAADDDPWVAAARALGPEIQEAARALPRLPDTPARHCHGDLKISNLRFASDPVRATCLLDLDTLGRGTLAFELGDAMRSWANPLGEDRGTARVEPAIFAAAMRAWRDVAGGLATPEELASVVAGLETVCVELAARFCVDVFDDAYFGWDPARFGSRREHDHVRAQGQLALGLSVREQREALLDVMLSDAR
jgi:Ser/Thr protein kinase RdoA (MazF antagonist)